MPLCGRVGAVDGDLRWRSPSRGRPGRGRRAGRVGLEVVAEDHPGTRAAVARAAAAAGAAAAGPLARPTAARVTASARAASGASAAPDGATLAAAAGRAALAGVARRPAAANARAAGAEVPPLPLPPLPSCLRLRCRPCRCRRCRRRRCPSRHRCRCRRSRSRCRREPPVDEPPVPLPAQPTINKAPNQSPRASKTGTPRRLRGGRIVHSFSRAANEHCNVPSVTDGARRFSCIIHGLRLTLARRWRRPPAFGAGSCGRWRWIAAPR